MNNGNIRIQELKLERINQYNTNPKICKYCNSVLSYEDRNKKFCNSSCSASYNNKNRTLNENTKDKIRNQLKDRRRETQFLHKDDVEKQCKGCGGVFITRIKKQVYCSRICVRKYATDEGVKNKIKNTQLEHVKQGNHIGWKSRTLKPSYPEQYFINLFQNENIDGWVKEHKLGKYFIDFAFIDKKIALEIDGKQHWEDINRINSDKQKDSFLVENGWTVYRIKWFNPINDINKDKLYKQINIFKTKLIQDK